LTAVAAAAPPVVEGAAVYFDGKSARRRAIVLRLRDQLDIIEDGHVLDIWPYADIRRVDGGGADRLRLRSLAARELARLDIADPALAAAIVGRCPLIDDSGVTRFGVWKIVLWSFAAVCSIVLMALYGVPLAADRIAPLVPWALEKRLGDAAANQVKIVLGKKLCTKASGVAALRKLAGELSAQGRLTTPIEVNVLESHVANAFALPGGRVFILSGLIDKAESVDEVAGVLGHELGHVAHRDGLREMIASGGTGFLFGLLLGDVSGSGAVIVAGRALVNSAHSRDAEAKADAFAADAMRGLGRSPRPLGEFLLRMTGKEQGGMIALLASHPLSQDRLAALKAADAPVTGPELLSEAEWRALKGICE
jgi:Zn-dependent protease with chaperone function